MLAVVLREFGPPEALRAEEVPEPTPGPGEVVVDVAAASVTFVETQIRAGRPPHPSMLPELPAVLGNGVAGVVQMTGPGVDPSLAGARVVTTTGGAGGYAERAVAPAGARIRGPGALPLDEAAAVLADGRTALMQVRLARIGLGETVLVEAAAGGVGSLLVQLAKAAGARVVAAAGGADKCRLAVDLGADVAIDYREPGWAARAGAVDVVFDGVGGEVGRQAFDLLTPGGRFVPYGMASGSFAEVSEKEAAARGVQVVHGGRPSPDELLELSRAAIAAAAAGRLRPVIGQRVPLERAFEAHRAIEERRTRGKTLLIPG